jgi:hypothetical protein
MIACFWEREDAAAVAERLGGVVRRGRFHGEDDDEDHPWVVTLTEVDRGALEELLDEYDGWLEVDDEADEAGATDVAIADPPALPSEPRRLKR